MSNNIYLHKSLAADELLGHVNEDGKVYKHRFGPDKYVGRVDLESGKVYASKAGPDKKLGYVELESGRIYRSDLGPDDHIGNIREDGRMYRAVAWAGDDYIARIETPFVVTQGAAAYLLLVMPTLEETST
ncbi:MAG: hypothetical protein GY759_02260 [Chloroflexi bacterium]|nr:hypothetical protein [Chloroflexota bacterium]